MCWEIDKIDDLRRETRLQEAFICHSEKCVRLERSIQKGKLCLERSKNKLKKKVDANR